MGNRKLHRMGTLYQTELFRGSSILVAGKTHSLAITDSGWLPAQIESGLAGASRVELESGRILS